MNIYTEIIFYQNAFLIKVDCTKEIIKLEFTDPMHHQYVYAVLQFKHRSGNVGFC